MTADHDGDMPEWISFVRLDSMARAPSLSAEDLMRGIMMRKPFGESHLIAVITHPNANDEVMIAAIKMGPITNAVCSAALKASGLTAAVADAVIDIAHSGIARGTLIGLARASGAHRLAHALQALHCLEDARQYLSKTRSAGEEPSFEIQQASDAMAIASAALDHLLFDRDGEPPAPLRAWW